MMDDDRLIAAVAEGDHTALRELFDRHARWLAALRLLHLGSLLLWAALTLAVVARHWAHPAADLMLARNLAGFTGLALLGAWLLGGPLSWMLPIAFSGVVTPTGRDGPNQFAWWA